MPKTRINCPNCRQPIVAEVEQLFDFTQKPSVKQELLSGMVNYVQCPNCGYQGNLATPIVYHDLQKELLLTYVPPELGMPRDDQERMIGALINQVVNKLAPEQRKGYLLRPKASLTLQNLVEQILEADGITRDMIQAQQARVNLLQRLLSASTPDVRWEILKQDEKLVDAELFTLFSRLLESATASGDQEAINSMEDVQADLLNQTSYGQKVKEQTKEVQAALQALQAAGRDLSREKLLEIVIKAPNEIQLGVMVSLVRPLMDYPFFQLLSERIDRSRDKGRERLIALREQLLKLTQEYDEQRQARTSQVRGLLNELLKAENVAEATAQNLNIVDEIFVQALNADIEAARKGGDLDRLGRLQQIAGVIQQASAPPELALIEELLDSPDEQTSQRLLDEHKDEITSEFLQMLSGLLAQVQQTNQDPELVNRLKALNRQAIRFSMVMNLRGG